MHDPKFLSASPPCSSLAFLAKPLYVVLYHPSLLNTVVHPPQHVTLKKNYAMKLGQVACIALSAAAGCSAFTGGPVTGAASLRQKKVDAVAKVAAASPRPGLDGTRRDVIQTASAAVAGLLASAVLPAGALAAAKAEPNRKGVFGSLQGTALLLFRCVHVSPRTLCSGYVRPRQFCCGGGRHETESRT